ncbi:SusC/RagA family TonB-linked outer membrane protein [Flavilitoribacter nigricans]|uniref:TonB-dependent receptor plug domain-containing protein n=1 Tax=Flavilitoribacter nigricans (strain ATCC 23147 / DSM 23189 / NBRC 102662 / NCIMB 1420 / SS-2) TaxID=1122177 RepID=A0A2D0MZG6_FLAN2|nr:SusC/RagA family TonB-linked outer membrane protein [Flavilitoribacter nigricans]PHN01570.1 hypothetical protein CRP01_36325 [Flavilitoribacter nigricans DSM 23189 = NBRC 102662]
MKQVATPFLLALLLLSTLTASAQILRGKILRYGEAQSGLSIQKNGRGFKSLTDINGNFLIKAKEGNKLFVRQGDTTWILPARQNMEIELSELAREPEDTARPAVEKPAMTSSWGDTLGAVTTIQRKDFNDGNIFDPYGLIQGLVPGLTVAKPGGDPLGNYQVQLRGLHTFDEFTSDPRERVIDRRQPLLVIDGLPGADLLTLDPADIATIRILRDVASTAAYGLRGANGVIEIETRLPGDDPLSVTYHSYLAHETPTGMTDVLSATEFARRTGTPNTAYYRPGFNLGDDTDWQREISRKVWNHTHQLAAGGTFGNTRYQLALNYRDQQGVAKRSGFHQWNSRLHLQQALWKDRLKIGIQAAHTGRNFQDVEPNIFLQAAQYNPTSPIYSDTSTRYGGYQQMPFYLYFNPVAAQEQTTREGHQKVNTLGGYVQLEPLAGLELAGRYTRQHSDRLYGQHYPRNAFFGGYDVGGSALRDAQLLDNQHGQLSAAYGLNWSKHRLKVRAAYTYQRWDLDYEQIIARQFTNDDFSYERTDGAANLERLQHRTLDEQIALTSTLEYHWNKTVFVKGLLRREGASRLGPKNKWAWFPGLQTAVSLHRIFNWSNRFHLRMSYGEAGQLPPKNFASHWKVGPQDYMYYAGQYIRSYDFTNTPNPGIGAEHRSEWNIGLDFGLLANRIRLNLDWYRSTSRDIIARTELPTPPYPQISYFDNFGALQNQGLEVGLATQLIDNTQLQWHTGLQFSTNTTRMLDMNHPQARNVIEYRGVGRLGSPGLCCTTAQRLEEGEKIGNFYGPVYQGIDQEGRWQLADLNNNGIPDFGDEQQIGNAQPDLQFGWTNDLQWGAFELSWMLRGILGHDLINAHRIRLENPESLGPYNVFSSLFEGEKLRLRDYPVLSSYYVEDASFVRLDYLTLAYRFKLPESARLSGLQLYLNARNVFTLSAYSGPDPDLWLNNAGNLLAPGVASPSSFGERGLYFPARSFTLGVRLEM